MKNGEAVTKLGAEEARPLDTHIFASNLNPFNN